LETETPLQLLNLTNSFHHKIRIIVSELV